MCIRDRYIARHESRSSGLRNTICLTITEQILFTRRFQTNGGTLHSHPYKIVVNQRILKYHIVNDNQITDRNNSHEYKNIYKSIDDYKQVLKGNFIRYPGIQDTSRKHLRFIKHPYTNQFYYNI